MAHQPLAQSGRVLVVDDEAQVRELTARLLRGAGWLVDEASSGEQALELLVATPPDLVLLDIQMRGMSGHKVLEAIRSSAATRLLPVIMLTGAGTRDDKLRAIQEGVTDFITKPFDTEELIARVGSLIRIKWFTDELEEAERVIITLARTIDARDRYTAGHSERVSRFAGLLGERIGLNDMELRAVRRGALFHDLGKIAVRDDVLLKKGALTPEEQNHMKIHPVAGRELIQPMKSMSYALDVVYHHHERMDGSGYPAGLSGEAIPLAARITMTADIYDALTSDRVYRPAVTRERAIEMMTEEARKGWRDARLLDEFKGVLEKIPEGLPG
ncbi:MAG: response regulator [Nitrospirae bacterium]|nr:response regulator [Nitrospirota bacterium]